MTSVKDTEFYRRREETIDTINALDRHSLHDNAERGEFFDAVYEQANGDAALVPWADLQPKTQLKDWLKNKNRTFGKALDIACGLGDNAECLARAGYKTTAFDFSKKAIEWAKLRFPDSSVSFHEANLFDLPMEWHNAFDLVHECYTLQAIPPGTLEYSIPAVVNMVAPGGTLLVYTRIRKDGAEVDGPPWPLEETQAMSFDQHGFELVSREDFSIERPGRLVPAIWCEWKKT